MDQVHSGQVLNMPLRKATDKQEEREEKQEEEIAEGEKEGSR